MKQGANYFSERFKSIGFAIEGILVFIKTEAHAAIHAVATVFVIAVCFLFPVSFREIIALATVTGMVWMAELMNTAIEKTMNLLVPHKKPEVKFIKDVAAGAVLVAVATAVLVACIVFIPKI